MLKSLRVLLRSTIPAASATMTAALLLSSMSACNPYERRVGEYNAGSVDPIKFPKAYLGNADYMARPQFGDPGAGNRPGGGKFQFVVAHAGMTGEPVIYYGLPFNGKQATSKQRDLSKISGLPLTYIFDREGADSAPDSDKCVKPDDYQFDRQTEAVRYDRQGNIFTKLPADSDPAGNTSYVPIVKEVVVHSNGNDCQGIKSEKTLVTSEQVTLITDPAPAGVQNATPIGHPSGRYFAFAVIDPAADVAPLSMDNCPPDVAKDPGLKAKFCGLDAVTGLGPQRWGWYQQYLLAYLDGGELKVETDPMKCPSQQCAITQKLYFPDTVWDADAMMPADNDLGLGYDLMEHKRGEPGYSPICEVYSYTPTDPRDLPKFAAEVDLKSDPNTQTLVGYWYCLQTP